MSTEKGGNGDRVPAATPSKLGRLFARIHESHRTERAIADTAKGRRVKAQQAREEREAAMSNGNSFGNGDSMSDEARTLPYWFRAGLPVPLTLVAGL